MKEVLEKLYCNDRNKLVNDILNLYDKQKFVLINFIYFAIIDQQKIFESGKKTTEQKEFKKFLMNGDFLLPDGMALQTYYLMASNLFRFKLPKKKLPNLNGTDFVPYFLDEIKKRYGSQRIRLYLYGSKKEIVEECKKKFGLKGFNVVYTKDGYSELDWKECAMPLPIENPINILLVARGTPTQETWVQKNFSKIKDNKFIVFTVGGLFDFIAATGDTKIEGTQKRAPKFIRNLKLERLRRFISDPKRNWGKIKSTIKAPWYVFKYLVLKKE